MNESDHAKRDTLDRLGAPLCEHCRKHVDEHTQTCGPLPLHLDTYEAVNLHQMLMELRYTEAQSGDWYGQVAEKLQEALRQSKSKYSPTPNRPYPNGSTTYIEGDRW